MLCGAALAVVAGCAARPTEPAVARVNGRPITLAALADALPRSMDTSAAGDSVRRAVLDGLVVKELFVQEAERRGLDSVIALALEREKKAIVTQELYNSVVAPGNTLSEGELQNAYRLLENEVSLRVIAVKSESLARVVQTRLAHGVPFETLAVQYSTHVSARQGGNLGFMPLLVVEEPLRSKVMPLEPGRWTEPVFFDNAWQIVQLVARRAADPPPPPLGEIRQELEWRLKQLRRRELANGFLSELRARLEFNPAGLDIMCKPADSITAAELEVPVAIKDKKKYVKVGRLMHLVRRFPPALDTAMKKYTVRREVEEDLLYEQALERGLDQSERVRAALQRQRADLLYQELYRREVSERVNVTDADVAAYHAENRDNFVDADPAAVSGMIRYRLQAAQRDSLYRDLIARLRSAADISIDERLLRRAVPGGTTTRKR